MVFEKVYQVPKFVPRQNIVNATSARMETRLVHANLFFEVVCQPAQDESRAHLRGDVHQADTPMVFA